MKNSVVILGQGPGFENCPWDTEKEIWGLNMSIMRAKRIDRLFMTDPMEERSAIKNGEFTIEQVKARIAELNIPFVSAYEYKDISTYEPYPILDVVGKLGVPYFVNTICYMIAYALLNGVKSIDMYGINQSSQTEYYEHKACVEFWVGVAVGMGVEINIHGLQSQVMRTADGRLYGYRMRYGELVEQLKVGELKFNNNNKKL